MKELIKKNKIIIGMVHFPPLPGTPNFDDDKNLSKIVNSISSDLDSLQNNGIDAVMFGNEGDRPYLLKASNETLSAMAYVIGLIKNKIKVPFGVNYLWDPVARWLLVLFVMLILLEKSSLVSMIQTWDYGNRKLLKLLD